MDFGITGRRAAVAAASRGLGRACAEALTAEGVQVAICGRENDALSSRLSASTWLPASSSTMQSGLNPARRAWASAVSMTIEAWASVSVVMSMCVLVCAYFRAC